MSEIAAMSAKEQVFARPAGQARDASAGGPVRWSERFRGWAVSSHALVDLVLREHTVFSAEELTAGPAESTAETPVLRSMLALDPPEHHRLRRLVSRAFTRRAIDRVEARIAHQAAHLLRELPPAPEIVWNFASPLTTSMLAGLLGLPADRQEEFARWTHVVAAFIGPATHDPARRTEFLGVVEEMESFVREARRVAEPDSVLASLAEAQHAGELSERELLDFVILLIVAGHETTTRLIYHTVLCLERFPDHLERLRASAVTLDAVIEEAARFLPPTGGVDRFTRVETSLDGHRIPAGHRVVALIAAANRDPGRFPGPGRFDPARTTNPHLGFGRGVHACLGAHLARREARIALHALLGHVPGRWHVPDTELHATTTPVGIDIHQLTLTPA